MLEGPWTRWIGERFSDIVKYRLVHERGEGITVRSSDPAVGTEVWFDVGREEEVGPEYLSHLVAASSAESRRGFHLLDTQGLDFNDKNVERVERLLQVPLSSGWNEFDIYDENGKFVHAVLRVRVEGELFQDHQIESGICMKWLLGRFLPYYRRYLGSLKVRSRHYIPPIG